MTYNFNIESEIFITFNELFRLFPFKNVRIISSRKRNEILFRKLMENSMHFYKLASAIRLCFRSINSLHNGRVICTLVSLQYPKKKTAARSRMDSYDCIVHENKHSSFTFAAHERCNDSDSKTTFSIFHTLPDFNFAQTERENLLNEQAMPSVEVT